MRIFKYKNFAKWAKSEKISDVTLSKAADEVRAGLVDANLGGGLCKKRVPRQGQGKRGGYRVLLAFQQGKHIFFLYGFPKNKQENISDEEKDVYLVLAKYLLTLTDKEISEWLSKQKLVEVIYEG
jgi:hypothetical protein